MQAVAEQPPEARCRYAVMVRDPELSGRALWERATALREATRTVGAQLWVNDRVDLAVALGADGVHLGRRSMPAAEARSLLGVGPRITMSCHDRVELDAARLAGVDGILVSPVLASPGKGRPLGMHGLEDVCQRVRGERLGVIALGGITPAEAADCARAGAHGIAAIRADLLPALGVFAPTVATPSMQH